MARWLLNVFLQYTEDGRDDPDDDDNCYDALHRFTPLDDILSNIGVDINVLFILVSRIRVAHFADGAAHLCVGLNVLNIHIIHDTQFTFP